MPAPGGGSAMAAGRSWSTIAGSTWRSSRTRISASGVPLLKK